MTVTQQEITFPYSFGGKVKTKIIPHHEANVVNFKSLEQYFDATQIGQVTSLAEILIAKMNTDRTSPEKPKLDSNDCVLVRHIDKNKMNFEN